MSNLQNLADASTPGPKAIAEQAPKFAANECIRFMILAINQGNNQQFYRLAEKYLVQMKQSGNHFYQINQAYKHRTLAMVPLDLTQNIKNFLTPYFPPANQTVYLPDGVEDLCKNLVIEWKHAALFREHNVEPRNKILFHGPSGNGKTTLARHLSELSGLPLFEIKSHEIIKTHLGETSANIAKLMEAVTFPGILFWDEIDTIAVARSNSAEEANREMDRVLNTMLLSMEKLSPDSILIGATNRLGVLDTAFLRRFDLVYEIPTPSDHQKLIFANQLLDYYNIDEEAVIRDGFLKDDDTEFIVRVHSCLSYSAIKDFIASIARKIIMQKISEHI